MCPRQCLMPSQGSLPAGATSMSMAVPLHKPHAAEEGRAACDEAWGGTARWGPDLQPALGSWGTSSPVGHMFLMYDAAAPPRQWPRSRQLQPSVHSPAWGRGHCEVGVQPGEVGRRAPQGGNRIPKAREPGRRCRTHQPGDASQAEGKAEGEARPRVQIGDGAL